MNPIYLDSNSTTPLAPIAWEAMQPILREHFGNPASSHSFGRRARRALEDARERIASLLDASPDEILFTSGATEANNLAIFGLTNTDLGSIVASAVEHPSVLEPIRQLTDSGFSSFKLAVSDVGQVHGTAMIPADARLVAVMLANHETGAIQPIAQLTARCQRIPFHCDAAAAAGKMLISFRQLGVTSMTVSAHKFHGPKGVGALLVRTARLRPQLFGGHQQHGKRPGTEPVALAVGMAAALQWSLDNFEVHHARLLELRQRLLDALHRDADPVVLNGPENGGLPHALNLSFPGCRADALLMSLDLAGVACSTGSACSSGSLLPSPVLTAMGKTGEILHSAMRFSLSPLLADAEIDEAAQRIARCVRQVRSAAVDNS